MPDKRRKRHPSLKAIKQRQVSSASTASEPATVTTKPQIKMEPASTPKATFSASQSTTTSQAKPTTMTNKAASDYPYVTSELKRIGIITAAIVVLLIVLAIVLPH